MLPMLRCSAHMRAGRASHQALPCSNGGGGEPERCLGTVRTRLSFRSIPLFQSNPTKSPIEPTDLSFRNRKGSLLHTIEPNERVRPLPPGQTGPSSSAGTVPLAPFPPPRFPPPHLRIAVARISPFPSIRSPFSPSTKIGPNRETKTRKKKKKTKKKEKRSGRTNRE